MKVRMVGLDFDGTVAHYKYPSVWELIANELGCVDEDERLKKAFFSGEFDVSTWSRRCVELYKRYGLTEQGLNDMLGRDMRPANGTDRLLSGLRERGMKVAVVSGSIRNAYDIFAAKFGLHFDFVSIAHELEFDGTGALTGGVFTNRDFHGKVEAMREMCSASGIGMDECAFIGNDTNDIPVFRSVGRSFAFNTDKRDVIDSASVNIDGGDISAVLGYLD